MPKLSLLLVSALIAACTPAPGAAPGAPAPMAPATAPAAFPTVTYTLTISPTDLPASAPEEMRAGMSGAWEVSFGTDGRFHASFNGREVVDGAYEVNGNELVFGEDTGDYACHARARYTWHATATELHLSRVEDSCTGRAAALTAHPLVRK